MTERGELRGEELTLTAAATPLVLERVQDELAGLWRRHPDVAGGDRVRFETGLVEVLANVVEHAFGPVDGNADREARELTVTLSVTAQALRARLEDNGRPSEVDLRGVVMPEADAESGRGLALALATLDSLDHEWRGGRNLWTLVCSRESAPGHGQPAG